MIASGFYGQTLLNWVGTVGLFNNKEVAWKHLYF
jgi:hypothetical protein